MPDTRIAESILALVTSRDRAASTVGDLLEQSASRGGAWFWSGVFRTATSLLWRGFADNTARMTGLAFLAVAIDGAASVLFAFLAGLVFFAVAYISGNPAGINSVWAKVWIYGPTILASFWIGKLLSRWAAGRELPATIAYILLVPVASLALSFFVPSGLTPSMLAWVFLGDLAQRLPALAGAALARRQQESKPLVN